MRAVTQRRYGDSSALTVNQIDRPQPGPDQVLIEVHAAALDRGTEHLMTGRPWLVRLAGYGLLRPKQPVPGLDVAGIVTAVGADVTRFEVGDEVFGIADGSFAEFAVASESKLASKPAGLSFEQAAASAVSGIAALQALTDVGGLEPGQRVLVIGASGGVGTFAVQLARALGGVVDGVAGTQNLELVSSLGADVVHDHRTTDIADIDQRYDLILDIGGRNPVRKLRRLLTPTGTLVIVGGEHGNRITGGIGRQLRAVALSPFVGQRLAMFVSTEHHSFIDRLAVHLDSGDVVPVIGSRFPLDQAADAMLQMEAGRAKGKTVIEVTGARS
ncbi:MAG: NAD(P)-dependent alcohol dehydrogenase [Ilumatobacter sp.]|uniref:NAD(P)-dependent alcohol dehydrogenase n=1 Tax=Ilumatobacter sp. TaxID=1967498 RepID=UPI0026356EBD|nr:NAD(P)-dependent alcohol dehydrogenase [Ilumatobacter sp.]MDJ0767333.1 NAD(P)-dependent alcohol dehydrogenase [Ilumatobacter sp.]